MRYESVGEVIKKAKTAFKGINRNYYEERKIFDSRKPFRKKIGFVNGTREIVVWQ